MATTLTGLPLELLAQIVAHIETARALSHLSMTCKRVHAFIENDGFRIFVQSRFPSIPIPNPLQPPLSETTCPGQLHHVLDVKGCSYWQDAAHALTSLSRNWDRRAFIAQTIGPNAENIVKLKRTGTNTRGGRRHGQTMGFVPVVDSYEAWYGGDWDSRKEVVAWGAGAALTMRSKIMGNRAKEMTRDKRPDDGMGGLDAHHHRYEWTTYHERGALEGRDDVTTVNLMSQGLDELQQVIVGRASGDLTRVRVTVANPKSRRLASYATDGRPVRSATLSQGAEPLLAACLSDSTLAMYPTQHDGLIQPTGETVVLDSSNGQRTWCSRFLNHGRLAVGLGPSSEPIHLYDVGRGELSIDSARKLSIEPTGTESRVDIPGHPSHATSVYSFAPLNGIASSDTTDGEVFLSGAYDGLVRLHDLRSSSSISATFSDPVDTSCSIYSLLAFGRERFIAGGSLHSLIKVFDLRMPGGKLYHAADLDTCPEGARNIPCQAEPSKPTICCDYHYNKKHKGRNWNVYIGKGATQKGNQASSPIYSLSRPSQCSPSFFAGVENNVIQVDAVSIMDRYPDPIYRNRPPKQGNLDNVQRKWDPGNKILCSPMYEHSSGSVTLRHQRRVGFIHGSIKGLDERWREINVH